MRNAVMRYLNGEAENNILREYRSSGFLVPPEISIWAYMPQVESYLCTANSWERGEYRMKLRKRKPEHEKTFS